MVGEDKLGAFPDGANWTKQVKEHGLVLTFHSGSRHVDMPIDTAPLEPNLLAALFHRETLVRSRKFDDYSKYGIISFSMRESLSALKAVYQEAGVVLALPAAAGDEQETGRGGN